MKFVSTKDPSIKVTFEEALFNQLPTESGLFLPEHIPTFTKEELELLRIQSLDEIALAVLKKFIEKDIPEESLKQIIATGLNFPIPINSIDDNYVLELFHGPTLAFKDVGARILARFIEYFVTKKNKKITVLVATSGDTGGAVASGFSGLKHVTVVILYPEGAVSKLQEEQMTRISKNIVPIAVKGSFDTCQQIVKQCLTDSDFNKYHVTTANSINIGRLIAQVIYYVYTWAKLKQSKLRFVVPSGNMGNVTAGFIAKKMGVPIESFIIACNKNDPVVKYYKTGTFKPQTSQKTISNAMDIGNPSNFERILFLCNNKLTEFKKYFEAVSVTDTETIKTITEVYTKHSYLLDPHTAVAWKAQNKLSNAKVADVIVSTASPIKFASEITNKTNIVIDDSTVIEMLQNNPKQKHISSGDYEKIKKIIVQNIGQ